MPISPTSKEWGFIDPKGKVLKPTAAQMARHDYDHNDFAKDSGLRSDEAAIGKHYVRFAIGNNGAVVFELENGSETMGRVSKFLAANKTKVTGKVFFDDRSGDVQVFPSVATAISKLRSIGESVLDTGDQITEAALIQHGWRKLR